MKQCRNSFPHETQCFIAAQSNPNSFIISATLKNKLEMHTLNIKLHFNLFVVSLQIVIKYLCWGLFTFPGFPKFVIRIHSIVVRCISCRSQGGRLLIQCTMRGSNTSDRLSIHRNEGSILCITSSGWRGKTRNLSHSTAVERSHDLTQGVQVSLFFNWEDVFQIISSRSSKRTGWYK